ncbi:MAG: internalization-related competence protein ComEC/Rec2, competence protein ComEC protein [Candidatus Paceibacter sp.]|nr:internalization-related competence protein ComEC/Rec2, competence protein ComEC protein [Candidatus Paceibacter sp.]
MFTLRYVWFTSWQGDESLRQHVGQKISIEGVIVEEPGVKESYTQLIVSIDSIEEEKITPTKALVYGNAYGQYAYGDRLKITAKLSKPENFQTENGRTFNYIAYLAKDRIFYIVRYPELTTLATSQGNWLKRNILNFKKHFTQALDTALPFPESRLAAGLVVAGKHALPKNIQEEFVKTGTVQVVVLSGYNITIVAEMVMRFLTALPARVGLSLGVVSIIVFTVAAGGSATIVRAVIMVMIALLGKSLRRKYNVGRALLISAILMLAANPMLLFFDPSFQLSFLATIGLIYVSPLFEKYFQWITPRWKLREVFVSTLATQVFVTPFLLYLTGALSIVAVPANLALFLLIPITMLVSFLTGTLGMISSILAWPVSFVGFLFLKTILTIVHVFSALPFASISFPAIPLWLVVLGYSCFTVILVKFHESKKHSVTYEGFPQRDGARTK